MTPQPSPNDELRRIAAIVCDTDRGESPFAWSDPETDHPAPDARTVEQIHACADQLDEDAREIAGPDAVHPVAAKLRAMLRRRGGDQ
ncbi:MULTISPECIES: hypothetical protein [unclassified Streptomyces]|uniref:hypothetical protein n=1 Tax=unclassified Streptomyces TaxID=2593676 RepID=UPI0003824544|nr:MULTISPECIES: hypothetical protein [unclassified Streptomyces]MYX33436.1 hypothetical protein [Streptomyces sp. SID8377]